MFKSGPYCKIYQYAYMLINDWFGLPIFHGLNLSKNLWVYFIVSSSKKGINPVSSTTFLEINMHQRDYEAIMQRTPPQIKGLCILPHQL